jgi:pimeloyl-ACP methyl ester carboxylesterase
LRAQLAELPLSFASWEQAADYQRRRNPKLPEQRLKASLPHVFRERSDGTITWKYDLAGLRQFDPACDATFNPWPELGRVACPVLVVRGHNAHLDNAAAFNAEVLAFLKRS